VVHVEVHVVRLTVMGLLFHEQYCRSHCCPYLDQPSIFLKRTFLKSKKAKYLVSRLSEIGIEMSIELDAYVFGVHCDLTMLGHCRLS